MSPRVPRQWRQRKERRMSMRRPFSLHYVAMALRQRYGRRHKKTMGAALPAQTAAEQADVATAAGVVHVLMNDTIASELFASYVDKDAYYIELITTEDNTQC